MTVDEIKIIVQAEVEQAQRKLADLERARKETQTGWQKLGTVFASMRDFMQGPIAAFNQVASVLSKVKQVSDQMESAWRAQAEASALLANVIKTTGASAWTTRGHLEEVAGALQKTTKYGDETVESMQTVLLGFRNITGKEFDQATEAALDMATVMGMDLTSAAQTVGKALDEPGVALDMLRRQGFFFTEQQKEMMKEMTAAGDRAGAQKIILDELAKTYGGAAKEAGGLSVNLKEKLKNAIGDVGEEIGRNISNNLAPYRMAWLNIATSISTALKAQNDFDEAMRKRSTGKGLTNQDQLLIAQNYLSVLKQTREAAKEGGAAVQEMYGNQAELDAQIKRQEELVKFYEMDIARRNAMRSKAERDAAAREAEAKKLAEAEAKVIEMGTPSAEAVAMVEALRQARAEYRNEASKNIPNEGKYWDEIAKAADEFARSLDGLPDDKPIIDPKVIQEVDTYWIKLAEDADKFARSVEGGNNQLMMLGDKIVDLSEVSKTLGTISTGWDAASGAINAYMDLQQNQADAEISALEKSGASEEVIAKKKNEIRKKQFDNEKMMQLASIAMNTASAVVEALPNVLLAGIIGGFGAVQAGLVASQNYVPMAEGGSGIVTKPTLFLAGEAGPEPFAFGGANNKRGMGMGTTQNFYIGGSVISERQLMQLGVSGMANAARGY